MQLQPYRPSPEIDPNRLGSDGSSSPDAVLDDAAPLYTVVMVRDQATCVFPSFGNDLFKLLFGLGCYHLYRRDQVVWAVREAAEN